MSSSDSLSSHGTKLVVVGLGYVGLPLAEAATHAGLAVTGFDTSEPVVAGLERGESHIDDLTDEQIVKMRALGFSATTDARVLKAADVIVICVPTPLALDGNPNLGAVRGAAETIATQLQRDTLVVLESTTFPGTTEDVVAPILAGGGLRPGVDFHLAFSPERVDPGNTKFGIRNTPKVVGGLTTACSTAAEKFYSAFVEQVVVAKGTREAETAKLLENTYRHINIALVNEMARVCHEMDIDIWDVVRCAATKPFGFQAFYPGPGVGGHCIPIDPNYLSYAVKAKLGYPLKFIELAQEINATMPEYVTSRIQGVLNRDRKAVNGSRVILVGVTYKADIADQRESPAKPLARHLLERGAELQYLDPFVESWSVDGVAIPRYQGEADRPSDLAVVLQHHAPVDLERALPPSIRILDTRGRLSGVNVEQL